MSHIGHLVDEERGIGEARLVVDTPKGKVDLGYTLSEFLREELFIVDVGFTLYVVPDGEPVVLHGA